MPGKQNEYPIEKLPRHLIRDDRMKIRSAQLFVIIKKQMLNVLEHDTKTFDMEVESFLNAIYNDGYSAGISHANKILNTLNDD